MSAEILFFPTQRHFRINEEGISEMDRLRIRELRAIRRSRLCDALRYLAGIRIARTEERRWHLAVLAMDYRNMARAISGGIDSILRGS